jgi:cell division protein FtsB
LCHSVKKKFLLANKHITKYALLTSLISLRSRSLYNTRLNSTLSVRIEELNAQLSTLYVENLRLRTSEIALTTQLKKEQEKSKKIMADAEAAVSVTYPEDPPAVAEIQPDC